MRKVICLFLVSLLVVLPAMATPDASGCADEYSNDLLGGYNCCREWAKHEGDDCTGQTACMDADAYDECVASVHQTVCEHPCVQSPQCEGMCYCPKTCSIGGEECWDDDDCSGSETCDESGGLGCPSSFEYGEGCAADTDNYTSCMWCSLFSNCIWVGWNFYCHLQSRQQADLLCRVEYCTGFATLDDCLKSGCPNCWD